MSAAALLLDCSCVKCCRMLVCRMSEKGHLNILLHLVMSHSGSHVTNIQLTKLPAWQQFSSHLLREVGCRRGAPCMRHANHLQTEGPGQARSRQAPATSSRDHNKSTACVSTSGNMVLHLGQYEMRICMQGCSQDQPKAVQPAGTLQFARQNESAHIIARGRCRSPACCVSGGHCCAGG